MIPIPLGSRVWIATGHTDMRRGMQGLALQVQEGLKRDPQASITRQFSTDATTGSKRSRTTMRRQITLPWLRGGSIECRRERTKQIYQRKMCNFKQLNGAARQD